MISATNYEHRVNRLLHDVFGNLDWQGLKTALGLPKVEQARPRQIEVQVNAN